VLLVVAVLIGAASRSQKLETPGQRNPAVTNNTKSFEVTSAIPSAEEVYLAFRNDYDKNVMLYVISCGDKKTQTTVTEDFAFSELADAGIPAHTVYERRISICPSAEKEGNKSVVVEAVILEDGTGDGNPAVVQRVRDNRLGQRIQMERAVELMEKYLRLPSSKMSPEVGDLKLQVISKLNSSETDNQAALMELEPARQSNVLSEEMQAGLGTGKESVLRSFQDAEAAQNTREELLRIKEYYKRVLRRL